MYWFSGDRWKSSLPTLRRSPQRARRSHSLWPPSRLIRKTEPSCRRLANSLLSNITLSEILKAQHFKPYPLRTVLVSRFLSLFFQRIRLIGLCEKFKSFQEKNECVERKNWRKNLHIWTIQNNDDLIIDSCDAFLRRFEGMLQPEPDRQLGQDANKSLQPLRLAILSEVSLFLALSNSRCEMDCERENAECIPVRAGRSSFVSETETQTNW